MAGIDPFASITGATLDLLTRDGDLFLALGTNLFRGIAIILIVLWLLGMVSGYTLGNFIYVLLVVAIVLFLVRLVSGRRVV